MNITSLELITLLQAWMWPFLRIAGLVMTAPVIGTRTVPVRIRLMVAIAITALLSPVLPAQAVVEPFSAQGLLISIQQVLIGAALGLAVRIVFAMLEIAGQIVAMQMGLGFAAMVDPQTGSQVPVVSQFYMVMATLMYIGMDGHLMLFQVLADSFTHVPIAVGGIGRDGLSMILDWSAWLLTHAVLIAMPAMVALMIINLAFGVMARAAPQLNIFVVGFPVMIIVGTAFMLLTLGGLDDHLSRAFVRALETASRLGQ